MSYIVVVNPSILGRAPGFADRAAIQLANYTTAQTVQMLAIITIIASAIPIFIMAFYAKRPFALAPGLGLNAFFAYTVVLTMGVSWQTALAATFLEGIVFIVITAVGARKYIINAFPEPVKFSVGTGIGLFLGIIGLNGMEVLSFAQGIPSLNPNLMSSPVPFLAVIGLFFTFLLYARGIKGSIIIGIGSTTIAAYLLNYLGYFPATQAMKSLSMTANYDITPIAGAFIEGLGNIWSLGFALAIFTFFFVDFFDTAGTLIGVSQIGDFLDEEGNLPEMNKPLMADAIGTTIGGMLGTSTVTTYIESAAGLEEGGRTGMTALVVGVLFLVALIFVPLAAGIPQFASHLALVLVALLMMRNITEVDWSDITHVIPAALTIIIMPLTYSIAYGIAAGIISYPVVKAGAGEWDDINAAQVTLALLFIVYFYVRTGGVIGAL